MPNPLKVRLPHTSQWVELDRYKQLRPSVEFVKFAQENCGHYRWQSHDNFITVIFESHKDAVWFQLCS